LGISLAQVLGHYAPTNVIRCAWLAEAKTLAFALGERGIYINTVLGPPHRRQFVA
jgi:3-oxoacyl-[acyl-carrier protein] reductase